MSQFLAWDRQLAAWTNAAQLRRSQLREAASGLAARGEEATSEFRARAAEYAERTRSRCEEVPRAMVDELRRRVNVLDLATKRDVEAQSKLGRKRLSAVVKEFRESQRGHDQELLGLLRAELREELETFAAAIADDLFAMDDPPKRPGELQRPSDGFDDDIGDDDEIDLVSYEMAFSENDEIDLTVDGIAMRSLLDAPDD